MFRASWLYHIPIYAAFFAAGAGSASYLTNPPVPAQQGSEAAPHPVRTVSWYEAHRPEMNQKFASCNDNPGGALFDPECQNALDAKGHIGMAGFIKGPPK